MPVRGNIYPACKASRQPLRRFREHALIPWFAGGKKTPPLPDYVRSKTKRDNSTSKAYLNSDERHSGEAKRAFRQGVHTNIPAVQSTEPGEESFLAIWQYGPQVIDVLRGKGKAVHQSNHLAQSWVAQEEFTVQGPRRARRRQPAGWVGSRVQDEQDFRCGIRYFSSPLR